MDVSTDNRWHRPDRRAIWTLFLRAGCDDGTVLARARRHRVWASSTARRKRKRMPLLSAIHDVEGADIGARVLRVTEDDDWLTASEIAKRVGRTRQSIGLLVRGDRGPGGFPAPVARHGSPNPLWSWADVEAWFERYEPAAVPKRGSEALAGLLGRAQRQARSTRAPSPLSERSVAPEAGSGASARRLSTRAAGRVQMSPVIASRRHAETAVIRLHRQP